MTHLRSSLIRGCGAFAAVLAAGSTVFSQQQPGPDVEIFGEPPAIQPPDKAPDVVRPAANLLLGIFGRKRTTTTGEQKSPKVAGMNQVLQFHDGRQMRGQLVEVANDEIVWSRIDVNQPLRFGRKDVRRISLTGEIQDADAPMFISSSSTKKKSEPTSMATLKLAGSDWLLGNVSSADGQSFSVELSENAKFDIARDQIAWMHFGTEPVAGAALSLANVLSWTVSGGETVDEKAGRLRFRNNSFVAKSMGLPNRFELSFELPVEKSENATMLWLQPYTPRPNSYSTGTVQISITETEIERCVYDNGFKRDKAKFPAEIPKAADGWNKFRVFYDSLDRKISVFKNGKKAGEWSLPDEKQGRQLPRGVCFNTGRNAGDSDLLIGNFRMKPWDGDFAALEKPADGDRLSLPATPAAIGKLTSISGTKAQFSGEEKELVPGAQLAFREAGADLEGANTQLTFGKKGEVSAADFVLRDGKVKCRTGFSAQFEIAAQALNSISFPNQDFEPVPGDVLVFKNGDELPGKLKSTANGAAIVWITSSRAEFEIQPDRVAGIRFGVKPLPKPKPQLPRVAGETPKPVEKTEPEKPALPTLELKNGDRIPGTIAGFGTDVMRFKHATLGEREIALPALANYFASPVFDGLSGWLDSEPDSGSSNRVSTPDRWIELDGSFFTRSGATSQYAYLTRRGLKLPTRFEVRCDATSFGNSEPYFSLSFFSKNSSGQMNLSFSHGELNIHGYSQRGNGRSFSTEVPLRNKSAENTKRRIIRVFVDSEKGSVAIMHNGVLVKKLGGRKEDSVQGLGHTVSFSSYGGYSPTKLSDIWVGPWDGEVPDPAKEPAATVSLINGDVATGRVLGLQDGTVKMDTDVGEFELPQERIAGIGFGGSVEPVRAAARVRLRDGGIIHAAEFRWEDGMLSAKSSVLGDIKLPVAEVAELIIAPALRTPVKNAPEAKKPEPEVKAEAAKEGQIEIEIVPEK